MSTKRVVHDQRERGGVCCTEWAFLRPLNVRHGESLYAFRPGNDPYIAQSYPDYLDLRDRNRSFDGLEACLPRAADHRREVALRLALGSTRTRILRQLLTEALLISVAGGAAGLVASVILLRRLSVWQPFPQFPMNIPVSPGAKVYMVALLLAIVMGLLFGIVPVRQVFKSIPHQSLTNQSF